MGFGRFSANAALREAWGRFEGARRTWVYMAVGAWLVTWLAGTALTAVLPAAATVGDPRVQVPGLLEALPYRPDATGSPWLAAVVLAALEAVFAGAFAAFALRRAVGMPVAYTMLADYLRFFPTFLAYGIATLAATYLMYSLGLGLFTLPLFLAGLVAFSFAQYFVVDRGEGPLAALGSSLLLVAANPGQTVLLLLFGGVANALVGLAASLVARLAPLGLVAGAATLAAWLAQALVAGLVAVAFACAYREAAGITSAGEPEPLPTPPAVSSGA